MARKKIQTLQPPPTERLFVTLFLNLEWLVMPSSIRGEVTIMREGHAPSIHTREEPRLLSYDALQHIDAFQPPRLCITESPHTISVRSINRARLFAKYTHPLEVLSVHRTRGRHQDFMTRYRTRVLNVAFAIPAVTREAKAQTGERNEEWGDSTQMYESMVELGWHLDMLEYSEQDLRTSLPPEIVRFFNCPLPKQRVLERIRVKWNPVPSWADNLQVHGPGKDHGYVCGGCEKPF